MSGEKVAAWFASAAVSGVSPVPSKLMRKYSTKYGSFPGCMPLALNQIWRAFSSTLMTLRTGQSPFVIWFFTCPVAPS